MYQHWVFDLDGTLVDSFSPYFRILERVLAEQGLELPENERRTCIGVSPQDYLATRLPEPLIRPALKAISESSLRDAEGIRPFPGIEDSLRRLSASGRTISIWTSRDAHSARLVLRHSGLEKYVSALMSGTCVKERKPHAEGIIRLAELHSGRPENMVMVGDHDLDVRGGRGFGAHTVRASWHGAWNEKPCSLSHNQFFSVRDFESWLHQL